ncbi:MAG: cysteine hydrolase [Dongiaceae bacterium]
MGAGLEPIGDRALHVVVDMQRVFAEDTAWRVPTFWDVMPAISKLCRACPEAAIFTRFITPMQGRDVPGRWQHYYRHWPTVTLDKMDKTLLDLVVPLAELVPLAMVCDKSAYSAFESESFTAILARHQPDTLIISGVETDVCVLATVYAAVDRGLRVVIPADGVTSWSLAGHRAVLESVYPRLDKQIDVASSAEILNAWGRG